MKLDLSSYVKLIFRKRNKEKKIIIFALLIYLTKLAWKSAANLNEKGREDSEIVSSSLTGTRSAISKRQVASHVFKSTYFLKIAKTGSTTMRRIIQRHVLANGLPMPMFEHQDLGHKNYSDLVKQLVPIYSLVKWIQANPDRNFSQVSRQQLHKLYQQFRNNRMRENQARVIASHTVYNKTAIEIILQPKIRYLATLRHPLAHLKSIMNYFGWYMRLKIPGDEGERFVNFFKQPEFYDKKGVTKNPTASAFGLNTVDSEEWRDLKVMRDFLQNLSSSFDVVLAEYFDESLVLLRQRYNWTYHDLMYMKFYRLDYKEKQLVLMGELLKKAHSWLEVDFQIYEMFESRQKAFFAELGKDFLDEVAYFKLFRKNAASFCSEICWHLHRLEGNVGSLRLKFSGRSMKIPSTSYHEAFELTVDDCLIMTLHEKLVYWLLQVRQRPYLCADGVWDTLVQMNVFTRHGPPSDMNMADVKLFCNRKDPQEILPSDFHLNSHIGCWQ